LHRVKAHSSSSSSSSSSRNSISNTGYTLEAEADRVTFLPGGPAQLDFGLFSG
jgi:hypothetical protein